MTLKTVIILAIGTCAMCIPMILLMKQYRLDLWKVIPVSIILTVIGTLSTYIWFWIENAWYGGRSFYGAVFLVPVVFVCVAKLFRIPYGQLMDCCAPAECVMLAIMKFQCLRDGCCRGRVLYTGADGVPVVFPSQIAELINALLVMAILMLLSRNEKHRGKIFGWYMMLYGVSRFALNLLREENTVFAIGLPAGNVWSILAVVVGAAWMHCTKLQERKKAYMAD